MKSTQCAICKDKEKIHELYKARIGMSEIDSKLFSARRNPDRLHFRFVKCVRCGLIFSNPILESKKIIDLYKKSDFNYAIESKYVAKTYFDYLEKYVVKKNISKIKLLDIGCGNGFFLEEAYKKGIKNIYGVEPGKASVNKAPDCIRGKIKIDVFRKGLFRKNFFDVICCFHTLDHVLDPNAFLASAKDLLKNGGIIFFIVHNTDGLSVKLLGERSPIFDIEHIYLFNERTARKIAEASGFRGIEVIDIANKYPISYWARLLPFQGMFKTFLLTLLKVLGLGPIPVRLSAGNIGIVARK